MAGRIALIDGDVLVYKAAWAAEQGIEWEDGVHTLHVEPETLRQIIETVLAVIERAINPSRIVMTLSDPGRLFRHEVYPDYKGNRKASRKPIAWKAARRYVEEKLSGLWRPRLEADDVMGILATGHTKIAPASADRIVCSVDKDMRQVPGLHFDWTKDEDVREVSLLDADAFFYAQVLAGDPTDGIPGLPGVGMKTAEKMLRDNVLAENVWDNVLAHYEKRGFTEEYALTMARLVRILRAEDYDFTTREVRLWTPS